MKLGSGRIAAVAVGVLALGAVLTAGPASAASFTHLCIDSPSVACAQAEGSGAQVQMQAPFSSTTNWVYPTVDNGVAGTIKQANTNLCMQLDAADGLIVREAACNGDMAENWFNRANPTTHRTEFESQW